MLKFNYTPLCNWLPMNNKTKHIYCFELEPLQMTYICFFFIFVFGLTLLTLSNFNGLFQSLFWIKLKRSIGVKGLTSLSTHFRMVPTCHKGYDNHFIVLTLLMEISHHRHIRMISCQVTLLYGNESSCFYIELYFLWVEHWELPTTNLI